MSTTPTSLVYPERTAGIFDLVAYVTLVAGYLLGMMQAHHLTIINFLAFTGLNLAWIVVYQQMHPENGCTERNWRLGTLLALAILIMMCTGWGVGFDWLIPLTTIGVVVSVLELKAAAIASVGMLVTTLGILYVIGNGFTSDFYSSDASLIPAFIFVFAFAFVSRQQHVEQQRSQQLLIELGASKAALEEAHSRLQAYADQVEELTITRERNRMAREIHDTLGHYLTILALQLETATKLEKLHDPRLHDELTEARRVAAECLTEVRHSVAALRPTDPTAVSLTQAIQQLVMEFEAVSPQVVVTLDVEGPVQTLPPEMRLALYRCTQESLTNIRKHADATKVLLRLRVDATIAELTVLDNGQGFATSQASTTNGFGLVGMRERLALLGGTVTAQPVDGQGWRVEVLVPLSTSDLIPVVAR